MSTQPENLAFSGSEQSVKPIIYKAYEFARSAFNEDYVKVREYRTYYYPEGRVSHEVVLMETPFEQLVRAFDGDFRKVGKRLTGLFDAPDRAKECARKVDNLYGKPVEISGNQITLAV